MNEINTLPSSSFWSLLHKRGRFSLLTEPKTVKKVFLDRVENLLESETYPVDGQAYIESYLEDKRLIKNSQDKRLWLVHLFYELGHSWNKGQDKGSLGPLAIILEFQEETSFDPQALPNKHMKIDWQNPTFESYEKAFEKGSEFLKGGDCYQYNLTFPFVGKILEGDLAALVSSLWHKKENVGEYAHLSFLDGEFYVTNTPECLFEWSGVDEEWSVLESRPIKGTMALKSDDKSEINDKWHELKHCEKNESELYMITDLIRNDLNRIDRPQVEVFKKKALLKVPGLIHSYSHLKLKLKRETSLLKILKSLFPGGSITGAPKIRVMDIIHTLEEAPRGFYCGSTLIPYEDGIHASINIRSAHGSLEQRRMTYHAGGGVTWESTAKNEYQEVLDKFQSFNLLLTSRLN